MSVKDVGWFYVLNFKIGSQSGCIIQILLLFQMTD